jgi:hypothetical protein
MGLKCAHTPKEASNRQATGKQQTQASTRRQDGEMAKKIGKKRKKE